MMIKIQAAWKLSSFARIFSSRINAGMNPLLYQGPARNMTSLRYNTNMVAAIRKYSNDTASDSAEASSDYEKFLESKLLEVFGPAQLSVRDISGGCGSMFAIHVASKSFKGIPMVKQHRMVNEALSDEIKKWHGVQLSTRAL
ncbi:bola protein [Dipodascopsis uninucleata]